MSRSIFIILSCTALTLSSGCSTSDAIDADGDDETSDGAGGDDTTDTTTSGTGGSFGGFCAEATGVFPVDPAPSNLLFLLDRSGSMHLRVGPTETRWTLTTAGLAAVIEAMPDETVAGLAMFPSGDAPITCCTVTEGNYIDCNCAAGELPDAASRCDSSTYEPLAVPMQSLDAAHDQSIIGTVGASDEEFYWGTPLAPALGGTLEAAMTMALPGVTSVVLLTDGLPTSCNTTSDPGANDLSRALDAASGAVASGVRTYVVGIDAEAASSDPATDLAINLSELATAGGTAGYPGCDATSDCAYRVNVDNFEESLAAALASIALEASSCTFAVPQPDGGEPDYAAVNITVTSDGNTQAIPRDSTHQGGWDYTPGNVNVQLYGAACELLKGDAGAKVEIVVGCTTIDH